MATSNNVEKALPAAGDAGLLVAIETPEPASDVVVEIENPDNEVIENEDGSIDIMLSDKPARESQRDFYSNLAEDMDENELMTLGTDLVELYDQDKRARADWEKVYKECIKLLGLKMEEKTKPWQGAFSATHPMIMEAVVRFQSEMISSTFPAKGPVLTKIIGKETREKMEAALRVQADMNHQLTDEMPEFRDEQELLYFMVALVGSGFKKVYFDESMGRQTSPYVDALDVVLPYGTSNIRTTPRLTHVMRKYPHEIREMQEAGTYIECDLPDPERLQDEVQDEKDRETGFSANDDERLTLLEMQVLWRIKSDERTGERTGQSMARPYVITILRESGKVIGVRRNWREGDKRERPRQHMVHYKYVPGFGPYGFGLMHLIGGLAKGATSILQQLVDAGTLANLPGGFKSRGMRIKGDDTPIPPGTFRDVDVGSGTMKDNIMPLPYKEPSPTLLQLMDRVVEAGRQLPGNAEMKVSDMSAQAPVGTTLAIIERQMVVLSAVQSRTHNSLKQELRLLRDLIAEEADDSYTYQPETSHPRARREDFTLVDVVPVSDPNAATLTQKLVQYQAVIQLANGAQQIYDMRQLHRGMLEVLGVKNADKLVPLPEDMKPMDPVTENMRILKGEPVKAFAYQDHEAHLAVHQAALQDPMMQQLIGQNPQAQMMMGAAMAHIAEHAGFAYRRRIEQIIGMPLPPVDAKLPPEVEMAISTLMAQAAGELLQQNQQAAAAAQAQQQAQDPVLQLQMREQDRKDRETAIKEKLANAKIAGDADKIRIAELELQLEAAQRADDMRLRERQATASEELNEQNTRLKAMHYGMMGRAQDQTILQKDRELAVKLLQEFQQRHAGNDIGESRE